MVVGAGASGSQIAHELLRAKKRVFLSVGPHSRYPRRYRERDYVWWLGVLGLWDVLAIEPGMEHVTIAVSGAYGGFTVDFRRFAEEGMNLVGLTKVIRRRCDDIRRPILRINITRGDANYLSILDQADAYVAGNGLDLPEEPGARSFGPDPECMTNPILELDLADAGVSSIIWATGYAVDFSWLQFEVFEDERPAKASTRRDGRARALFSWTAVAVAAWVILHLGRMARCQVSGGPDFDPTPVHGLPRIRARQVNDLSEPGETSITLETSTKPSHANLPMTLKRRMR